MKEINEIFRNYRKIAPMLIHVGKWDLLFIWISVIISAILPTVSTILMQDIINFFQLSKTNYQELLILFALYIICDVVLSILAIWKNYTSMILQQKLTLKIDMWIINKIRSLELQDFESTESYNKLQRAKSQSGMQVFNYFSHITNIANHIIMVLGSIIILLTWEIWPIAIVVVIAATNMTLLLKLNKYQYEVLRKRTGQEREKWYYQYILTNDIAFKEIKAFSLHDFFKNKFLKIAKKFLRQDQHIAKKNASIGIAKTVLEQSGNIIVLGKIFWDTYWGKILIGNTMAYIKAISNIKSSINNLFLEVANVYKESLYMSQLFEFLEMEINYENKGKRKIDCIQEIKIEGLNYRYRNSNIYALKDINMKIQKGDKFIVVGKNGSGKSTLAKIIAGFYEDYEGHIWVNGIDFHDIDKEYYRQCLGILFQDYNKYELKVRENVGVGNLNLIHKDKKIINSLEKANAPKKLINLDIQLGHWFNDGIQLSGGEWLRLAISRIFLRDADLYILDEPNAALDPIGESKILASIKEILYSKSCIFITHHISSIDKMPGNIIVMDKGEIVACGKHTYLLEKCKLYREMYQKSVELNKRQED